MALGLVGVTFSPDLALVGILGLGVVDARELIRMAALRSLATLVVLLPIQIGQFELLG